MAIEIGIMPQVVIVCLGNYLADRIFKDAEFNLPLTRKELAELSGMSAETVIRMLKKFHDEGLINMNGKKFKVLDYARLQKISISG